MPDSTNILIIGSGVAGSTIAAGLLERGIGPITMLEAGPRIGMGDRRHWLDFVTTGRRPYDDCTDKTDDFSSLGPTTMDLVGARLFARGGSTLHWGGWSLRLKPEDFHLKSAGGVGLDWPFSYDELEPHYGKAEHVLQVAGDSSAPGMSRSTPFPFESIPYTKLDRKMIAALETLGYGYGPMPIARNIRPINGMPACQTTGTCKYCPLRARYTADQTLDRLDRDPRFELRLSTAVRRINMASKGRAAGVDYVRTDSGAEERLDAQAVIVCAGAIETPKLLIASADSFWPKGIGNDSDHVGRHFTDHPLLFARGVKRDNPERLQHELDFPVLSSRHFDTPDEQPFGKLFFFLPPVAPNLNLAALMKAGQSAAEMTGVVEGPHRIELQAFMEDFAGAGSRIGVGNGTNAFGLRSTIIALESGLDSNPQLRKNLERLEGVLARMGYEGLETGIYGRRPDHATGTCRMALSATDGVVTPDLGVHDVENLYVCSNAVFPSGAAVNPTLTLTALALRFAERFPGA